MSFHSPAKPTFAKFLTCSLHHSRVAGLVKSGNSLEPAHTSRRKGSPEGLVKKTLLARPSEYARYAGSSLIPGSRIATARKPSLRRSPSSRPGFGKAAVFQVKMR